MSKNITYPIIYEDTSFLSEMCELNDIYFDIIKESIKAHHAYININDPDILTESLTDVASSLKKFFSKMIEKIKEFFRKFFMTINAHFMEIDKFVKKYKAELDKVENVKFSITGYKFNVNKPPSTDPFKRIVDEYNRDISDLKNIKDKNTIKDKSNKDLSNDNINKIKEEVLNDTSIKDHDDYLVECRKYYRDGEVDAISIEVDTSMFRKAVSDVPELVKKKKDAEKLRDDVISLLRKTESFFDKKISSTYVDKNKKFEIKTLDVSDNKLKTETKYEDYSTSTKEELLDAYMSYKAKYLKQVSSIITIAMTEYANAYKDKVKMTREIITKSLSKSNQETKSDDK